MVAALHSYTHPTWLRIWGPGPGSLMLSRVIVCGISYNDVCGLVHALLPSLFGCCILRWHCCLAVLASLPSLCCVATLVMLALLSSSLHSNRLRCWGSASLVESKWCYYVMVEADSHLGLLPTSILHIYKVFEHIDMTSIGIHQQPYTVIPTLFGSDFGVLCHLWNQNDVIVSWLMLTPLSNCFMHPS